MGQGQMKISVLTEEIARVMTNDIGNMNVNWWIHDIYFPKGWYLADYRNNTVIANVIKDNWIVDRLIAVFFQTEDGFFFQERNQPHRSYFSPDMVAITPFPSNILQLTPCTPVDNFNKIDFLRYFSLPLHEVWQGLNQDTKEKVVDLRIGNSVVLVRQENAMLSFRYRGVEETIQEIQKWLK